MNVIRKLSLALLIVGGINWGLVGFFDFNLVAFLFDGISTVISRVIYSLVGISAIVTLIAAFVPEVDEEEFKPTYTH